MTNKIAILAGDGIGPEVVQQALHVLEAVSKKFHFSYEVHNAEIGGAAFIKYGKHFPEETRAICEKSNGILFGSVGGPINQAHLPQWKDCEKNSILALRKTFQLNINLRPARIYKELKNISPLRSDIVDQGVNLFIIRELVGDVYFGEHKQFTQNNERHASDIAEYSESQIRSAAQFSFELARKKKGKLTSVDKANVLEISRLWREIFSEVSGDYPDVKLEHMLVDNCAMQLILNPSQFDVIATSNLFGDILSDEAAALPGSLGLMPSASFNAKGFGLYEPSGGSAPDIAGKDIANPVAQLFSLALLLRYSLNQDSAATAIENAIQKTWAQGFRTKDIAEKEKTILGTKAFAEKVIENL